VQAFKAGMAPIVIGVLFATGWIITEKTPGWGGHILVAIASALLVWRTRINLLVLVAGGAFLGAMGWI
jgi:chromate transporter